MNVVRMQRESASVAVAIEAEFLETPFSSVVTGLLGMRMKAKAGLLRLIVLRTVCVGVLEGQVATHELAALADGGTLWGRATMVAACRTHSILGSADSVWQTMFLHPPGVLKWRARRLPFRYPRLWKMYPQQEYRSL
jgi:hypothetical protein